MTAKRTVSQTPTHDDVLTLLKVRSDPAVSMYMPADRTRADAQKSEIRFKNLLTRAENELAGLGRRDDEAQAVLDPLRPLLGEDAFWRAPAGGYAFFIHGDTFHAFRLPNRPREQVWAGERCHVKALTPALEPNASFYALALSLKGAHLYECARDSIEEAPMEDAPESLEQMLALDDFEASKQGYSSGSGGPGAGPTQAFHGQGDARDDARRKEQIVRFCRALDQAVRRRINGSNALLTLVGVEPVRSVFADATHYERLSKRHVAVNPTDLTLEELHRKVWEVVEEVSAQPRREALERLQRGLGRADGSASIEIGEILHAAVEGRVETVLLDAGATLWGEFDPNTAVAAVHAERREDSVDLLEEAVAMTLQRAGTVLTFEEGELPDDACVAALMRF